MTDESVTAVANRTKTAGKRVTPPHTKVPNLGGGGQTIDVGSRFRAARNFLGLTQAQMAERLNTAYRTYQAYERNDSQPKMRCLVHLILLGISIDWLLDGQGEMLLSERTAHRAKMWDVEEELLTAAIFAVEETGGERGLTLSPGQKAQVTATLYHLAMDQEGRGAPRFEKKVVLRLFRLVS